MTNYHINFILLTSEKYLQENYSLSRNTSLYHITLWLTNMITHVFVVLYNFILCDMSTSYSLSLSFFYSFW